MFNTFLLYIARLIGLTLACEDVNKQKVTLSFIRALDPINVSAAVLAAVFL